ncbi:MAG: nitrogen fixation protein NifQ [Pseudomonadota bacterium]
MDALVLPTPDWNALAGRMQTRRDEITDLMGLLRDHADPAAGTAAQADSIAWSLACASLGDQHLWQDLGLPSRRELSLLIEHWFPTLAALNTHNMKWKKFFYKQLCLREELLICRAPSCSVCSDHHACFGPEEAAVVVTH